MTCTKHRLMIIIRWPSFMILKRDCHSTESYTRVARKTTIASKIVGGCRYYDCRIRWRGLYRVEGKQGEVEEDRQAEANSTEYTSMPRRGCQGVEKRSPVAAYIHRTLPLRLKQDNAKHLQSGYLQDIKTLILGCVVNSMTASCCTWILCLRDNERISQRQQTGCETPIVSLPTHRD